MHSVWSRSTLFTNINPCSIEFKLTLFWKTGWIQISWSDQDLHCFPLWLKIKLEYLFDLILYIPVNNFSVICMSGQVFLSWTSTKQGLMCLAQGHNTVTLARLEISCHSTTEPLRSPQLVCSRLTRLQLGRSIEHVHKCIQHDKA